MKLDNQDQDPELQELLKPLSQLNPSEARIHGWDSAVRAQVHRPLLKLSRSRMVAQLVAAAAVGVVIGGLLVKFSVSGPLASDPLAKNSGGDATFEWSHDNLD